MKWSISQIDDSNISDQERKCAAVRAFCTAKTDDERISVAQRYHVDCVECVRRPFCYIETLMDMCSRGDA